MKILSIDTSSKICNVVINEDEKIIASSQNEKGITHSEMLMTEIDDILKENSLNLEDIDKFGIITGPGSFTGIRIGISTIKGLVFLEDKDIITATSLELLLENIFEEFEDEIKISEGEDNKILNVFVSLIDSRNQQVYGLIKINENEEYFAGDIYNFLDLINYKIEKKVKEIKIENINIYFAGTGNKLVQNVLSEENENENKNEKNEFKKLNNSNIKYIEDEKQKAINLGNLIFKNLKRKDKIVKSDSLLPMYLKKSQAERLKKD